MNDRQLRYVRYLAGLARDDAYAEKTPKGYRKIASRLSQLVIERHLEGKQPIGVYLIRGSQTRIAVLDLDDHSGSGPWEEMVSVASRIIATAEELGLHAHCFRSGGGHGIHLWFIWPDPQEARDVRHLLREVLEAVGLANGTTGIAKGTVEIFPKQDRVDVGGMGSMVALPGARASEPLARETFDAISWDAIDPDEMALRLSRPVPPAPADERASSGAQVLPGDEGEAEAALKYVPADDYHVWLRVGLALKSAFGEAGSSLFEAWSRKSTKYEGADRTEAFWHGLRPKGSVTLGTVFHLAREAGWNGPSNQIIREMNAAYGIYTHGRTTEIILKDAKGGLEGTFIGKAQLLDRLAGDTFERRDHNGQVERISKASFWLRHAHASHFSEVVFDPSMPPGENGETWNLWRGFAIEPEPGDWQLLKAHILENVGRGDHEIYEWLMNWMALGVQQPGLVIGTAPVLIGFPGTGKGVLAHAYGRLWGPHFIAVTHAEHVVGRFGGHLFGRRFVFIDEGIFGGNRKDAGTIKTRLTDPTITLERKGVDAVSVRNTMIVMVASNESSVVPADKGDRRWMVIEVGDVRREDQVYFGAIHDQMEGGGHAAMLHELLGRDVSLGPDPRKTIKTEALFEQMLMAQPAEVRYLHGILAQGRLPQNWVAGPASTTIRALLSDLRHHYRDAMRIDEARLGRFINKAIPGVKRRTQAGVFIAGSSDSGLIKERSTQYDFPRLSDARAAFSRHVNMPVSWPEVDGWQSDPDRDDDADYDPHGVL